MEVPLRLCFRLVSQESLGSLFASFEMDYDICKPWSFLKPCDTPVVYFEQLV